MSLLNMLILCVDSDDMWEDIDNAEHWDDAGKRWDLLWNRNL